jgi:citrate lyase subunit beta/citryl-CoA lyase
MIARPRRSALYMPGSNARALERARHLPADVLIFDLEDAVAPEAKERARRQVAEALQQGGYGGREIVVRVNQLQSDWASADLEALAATRPDAILFPKISTEAEVHEASGRMDGLGFADATVLWAMMETPRAILNAASLAASGCDSRLRVMVMGTNDLAKETRCRLVAGRAPMLAWLSLCVAAARAHGLGILDGVWNDLADTAGLASECEQGRMLGMDGKTVIHPGQLATCNAIFAPQPDEVEWARRILAAFEQPENSQKAVLQIDGRMVERLHAAMARDLIAVAEMISPPPA